VDEEADACDDHGHEEREGVNSEFEVCVDAIDRDPFEKGEVEGIHIVVKEVVEDGCEAKEGKEDITTADRCSSSAADFV
jgi:hypothetical protein